MHAFIAQKIERDPGLPGIPRNNLNRWRHRWTDDPPAWFDEWRATLPELADLIDGSIGKGSAFHELYGYYAQGVGEEYTAILPRGWRDAPPCQIAWTR